jgi:hypothetical protein
MHLIQLSLFVAIFFDLDGPMPFPVLVFLAFLFVPLFYCFFVFFISALTLGNTDWTFVDFRSSLCQETFGKLVVLREIVSKLFVGEFLDERERRGERGARKVHFP